MSGVEHARVRSLDAYRGIAVLLMIIAHACDAFLAEVHRSGTVWHAVNITFGFVAPAFLFLAGATLGPLLRRNAPTPHDSHGSKSPPRSRHARRYALILLLAYWLQIPVLSLRQLVWSQRPHELARLFDCNILHVLAIGGLGLIAIDALFARDRSRRFAAAAVALALVIVAPYVWHSDVALSMFLPLRAFVAPQPASTFPIVPFAAYMLAGYALWPWLTHSTARHTAWLAIASSGAAGTALALDAAIGSITPHDDYWNGSAQHSLMRFAGVLAGAAATAALRPRSARRMLIERIGQASLAIYVLHLVVIYGSPMTIGLRSAFNGALASAMSPFEVAVFVVGLAACVIGAVFAWSLVRRSRPAIARASWWLWWSAFAVLFALTP